MSHICQALLSPLEIHVKVWNPTGVQTSGAAPLSLYLLLLPKLGPSCVAFLIQGFSCVSSGFLLPRRLTFISQLIKKSIDAEERNISCLPLSLNYWKKGYMEGFLEVRYWLINLHDNPFRYHLYFKDKETGSGQAHPVRSRPGIRM